jgi:sugar phosphate isomerase/epimerase
MQLDVFQSMWAMEGLPWRGDREWDVEERLEKIAEAGFAGVNVSASDAQAARRTCAAAVARGLRIALSGFPTSVDELRPILDTVEDVGRSHVDHLNLQPNIRPRMVSECLPYLSGWSDLAEQAGVPTYVETHRDRMTTDLLFTLDLLEAMPQLQLTADLSHYVVGREFAWPIDDVAHEMIRTVLLRSRAFHGRVASREQVQIQLSFAQHRPWLELFAGWWEFGLRHLRSTLDASSTIVFTTELGPTQWYAITGPDGAELSDRWAESLALKDLVGAIWSRLESEQPVG